MKQIKIFIIFFLIGILLTFLMLKVANAYPNIGFQYEYNIPYIVNIKNNDENCLISKAKLCRIQEITVINPLFNKVWVEFNCGIKTNFPDTILFARTKHIISITTSEENEAICKIRRWKRMK